MTLRFMNSIHVRILEAFPPQEHRRHRHHSPLKTIRMPSIARIGNPIASEVLKHE